MVLRKMTSRWVRAYYVGADHPFKLRLCSWFFRMTKAKLCVPYAEGKAVITVSPWDGVEDSILRYGYYEPEVWNALSQHAKQDDVLWDVGANIGGQAIRAGLDSRIKAVHCFEPNPTTFRWLNININLNPSLPICSHLIALSDKSESLPLFGGDPRNSGQTSLRNLGTSPSSNFARCLPADQVISLGIAPVPNLMKVDVEGWEANVFRGAKGLFEKAPPRAIAFECSHDGKGRLRAPEIENYLGEFGYHFEHIPRNYGRLESVENFLAIL